MTQPVADEPAVCSVCGTWTQSSTRIHHPNLYRLRRADRTGSGVSIEQVAVTIHYDPGSWPHWHWRAEIVGSERGRLRNGHGDNKSRSQPGGEACRAKDDGTTPAATAWR